MERRKNFSADEIHFSGGMDKGRSIETLTPHIFLCLSKESAPDFVSRPDYSCASAILSNTDCKNAVIRIYSNFTAECLQNL